MEKKNALIAGIALFAFSIIFVAKSASAATLYFAPSSITAHVGRSFTVSVDVNSLDQAMNATQGTVSFPNDKLEVVSVSTRNSAMNLWVTQPSFSNKDGLVRFAGIAMNPGFEGAAGKIITITFLAKSAGSATLALRNPSVLANDGKGTNILSGTSVAALNLAPPSSGAQGQFLPVGFSGFIINSDPPLASGGWYNLNAIKFYWDLPVGATAVSFAMTSSSDYALPYAAQAAVPGTTYDLSSFGDGTWYFSLALLKENGWTETVTKMLRIDRTPPNPFTITRIDSDLTNQNPVFAWAATDRLSGISHYDVKIGSGDWFDASEIRDGPLYILPDQSPQESLIMVRAYDQAGNFIDSQTTFRVLSKSGIGAWFYYAQKFLSEWSWLIVLILIILNIASYAVIYVLFRGKRYILKELHWLKNGRR